MRIAAISHSCTIDVNQRIYLELSRHPGVELLLIAPLRWRSSLRGTIAFAPLEGLEQSSQGRPILFPGSIHFHSYRHLYPTLERFRPDLLYMDEEPYSYVTSQGLAMCRRLGCKFVFYTKQNLLKHYPPPFSLMERQVLRATDHAMAVSEGAAQVLRESGYDRGITILPHGVDTDTLTPRDSEELRVRLGVQRPILGYAGRIEREKGVWDLLEAARVLVERRGPTFTVLLIGDGRERWRLAEAAAASLPPGVFQFTGSVAHNAIADYLNVLDVLVLPSRTRRHWKEQFGRVLVEALACEVPLVGSDSGHIPELVRTTGGGLVFHEGQADDLADKLGYLMDHPGEAREMALRGRQVVLQDYSYPRVAQTLYEALKGVV